MKEKILKSNIFYTFLSILIGFLVGAILLQIIGVSSLKAYGKLIQGVFGKPKFMRHLSSLQVYLWLFLFEPVSSISARKGSLL